MIKKTDKDYQTLNLELEEVLAKLQQPGVRADEAVKLYETGLALIEQLHTLLNEAENRVQKLTRTAAGEEG